MRDFTFQRTFSNNKWNINNPDDVDAQGESVTLARRIVDALPGNPFTFSLTDTECLISFENPLDGSQQTTLNNTVSAHEAANGNINPLTQIVLVDPNGQQWAVRVSILGVLVTVLIS